MSKLRDYFEQDFSTFFNQNEFSTMHNINGKDMLVQIDNDLLKERQAKYAEGTYLGDVLFHVPKSVFGDRPTIGRTIIKFGTKPYQVTDFQEDEGIYTITLGVYMS